MKASDLKEAAQIVSSIEWCDRMLKAENRSSTNFTLPVVLANGSGEAVALGRDIRAVAFRLWLEAVTQKRAELVRRAAQIGLTLEN